MWGGVAVGLRDGAVLALLSAGLTPQEVAHVQGRQLLEESAGKVQVVVVRGAYQRAVVLDPTQSARLIAWVAEAEVWGRNRAVFGLTRQGINRIITRYCKRKGAKR